MSPRYQTYSQRSDVDRFLSVESREYAPTHSFREGMRPPDLASSSVSSFPTFHNDRDQPHRRVWSENNNPTLSRPSLSSHPFPMTWETARSASIPATSTSSCTTSTSSSTIPPSSSLKPSSKVWRLFSSHHSRQPKVLEKPKGHSRFRLKFGSSQSHRTRDSGVARERDDATETNVIRPMNRTQTEDDAMMADALIDYHDEHHGAF